MVPGSKFSVLGSRFSVLGLSVVLGSLLASCSEDTSPVSDIKVDSNKVDTISTVATTQEVQTDSGRLIITSRAGQEIDEAVLLDAQGKIIGRGQLYNNQPTGAWLRYDADGNVENAVHHAGTTTYTLDPADFKTERVKMTEMGISFVKPVDWDTVAPFNPATFVSYEKEVNGEGMLMNPNINISKGNMEANQTVESLAGDMLNMLHNTVGRVDLVDESYLTIDSCKSFRRYGMYYTNESKFGFLDAIIVHGSNVFVISCTAPNMQQGEFLKYQSVFENLVLSVQID
jgi:hypothetical protein